MRTAIILVATLVVGVVISLALAASEADRSQYVYRHDAPIRCLASAKRHWSRVA